MEVWKNGSMEVKWENVEVLEIIRSFTLYALRFML